MDIVHEQIRAAAQELRRAADTMGASMKQASNEGGTLLDKQANIYRNLVYLHLLAQQE